MTACRLRPYLVLLLAFMVGSCRPLAHRVAAPAPARDLGPGIRWWQITDPRGPWRLSVVRVDLTQADVRLRAVHAHDALLGRETTSSLVRRQSGDSAFVARVGINADFFDLSTGRTENNQVTDGEWWVGRMLTDSPFDSYDNVHSQFAVSQTGRGSIGRYVLDARAWTRAGMLPVLGVNHAPGGTYEGTVLYTARYGARTPHDTVSPEPRAGTARRIAEVSLAGISPAGDTLRYVVLAPATTTGGTTIPERGAVFSATGDRITGVQRWQRGDTVRVWLGILPRLADGRPPQQLIGGWPRVVEDSVNIALEAATREGTISRNAEARHPRSAVGLSSDGRTLWLVAVDGRSAQSVGMTLVELGDAMRALGAWDALNFDGGGSTTLVVDGRIVNAPTDATGERPVGNALLVLQRHRAP